MGSMPLSASVPPAPPPGEMGDNIHFYLYRFTLRDDMRSMSGPEDICSTNVTCNRYYSSHPHLTRHPQSHLEV